MQNEALPVNGIGHHVGFRAWSASTKPRPSQVVALQAQGHVLDSPVVDRQRPSKGQ